MLKKKPQKRGRKATPAIARPSLPRSMKYVIKKDQITKCLLLLELEQNNSNVLHIRHASGRILNFGIKEFALITGLKCKGNTKDFAYPVSTPSRLFQKYFPNAVNSISKNLLVQRFLTGNWKNNQDALPMATLYFVHTFILSQIGDSSISINEFLMAEDGSYRVYPWGQIAFSKLMISLQQNFNLNRQMYCLYGMSYALNVWTYECASQENLDIAVKERDVIPRIFNWRAVVVKPKFEMLMSSIFQENACSNIVLTPEEPATIDLPEDEHAPPSSPPTTSVNPKVVQSKDISNFDDFSTRPPEQLLRRSSKVCDTSSPPPPKRRKKDESLAPAANVHVSTDAQNVNYVIPDIEELKDYLKNYKS
ncbi:hypothetical protein RDI58_001185 [Solanum bulbocastanum]|uniref:DUF1985 domain-containing protein n=1 Tax=Solanum bulbocastanum TaxID=147425 RepID=A0AAN8YPY2_SOLBU